MLQRRNLLKDKRGDFTGVLYFVVSIAAFAIFLLIVGYIGNTLGTEIKSQVNSTDDRINNAFDKTVQVSTTGLSALWFILFGGLLIGLMITAWFIPTYPIFAVPFIILLVIAIILGVAMSNAYELLAAQAELSTIAAYQGGIGWFMSILPYLALVVGLITIIVTFAKPGQGGASEQTPVM